MSLTFALYFSARIHHLSRDIPEALKQAEALVTLAIEQGFSQWKGTGIFMQGAALVAQGQDEVGLEQMHQGLKDVLATGSDIFRIPFLIMLSGACCKVCQAEEGLTLLAEAMAAMEECGRSDEKAEGFRLQGELMLRQGTPDMSKAEDAFQNALEITRQQNTKSWELRAATSLARLWQQQGKCQDAYELLAPVYGWFTEGFDTADVQEAKGLLAELST